MTKRSLFVKRVNAKPFEYPELLEFMNAIQQSYWLHTEFNYQSDVQDYHVNVAPHEKTLITRTMLAISQIEVTVKRFWATIYDYFPKHEIDLVGLSFSDSEVRHFNAYSFLLDLLNMNELFERIHEFKPLMKRVEYMEDFMAKKNVSEKDFVLSMVLFSLFIEHISLFGQFYTIMSFNKFRNQFKGMSNAVEATSKEEELHGKFGIALYHILHVEHNELFTPEFYEELIELAEKAYQAELEIIDWMFEEGDTDFLSAEDVKNFVRDRYNKSLQILGINKEYPVDKERLRKTEWFNIELLVTKENDFFNKRSIDYTKRSKAVTVDDLGF